MTWKLRKQFLLILLGVIALTLSIIVWLINQNASTDLLAGAAFVGGLAIVLNSLPDNGNNDK